MLKAENLKKTFGSDEKAVHAVRGASFTLRPGETAAIVGPSGSGKSTFLNMLALILPPDEGKVYLDGEEVSAGSDGMRCRVRGRCFGMIRQDFALIDDESVYANIRLPLVYNKSVKRSEQRRRIIEAAEALGIADKLRRRAGKLSGGERQRAAIARAIVADQPFILADEPTGSLDAENRDLVMDILTSLARERGKGVVIVTHDPAVAARCGRVLTMRDGRMLD